MNPTNPHAAQRWLPFKNETQETIPAFAILALPPLSGSEDSRTPGMTEDDFWFHHRKTERGNILKAFKHNAHTAARGVASLCAVNGPLAVPAGGHGECTQDWPTRVLHDGRHDYLPNGSLCGPVDDKWYVSQLGTGFTCISHDLSTAVRDRSVHLVWVAPYQAPDVRTASLEFMIGSVNNSVAYGDEVRLFSALYANRTFPDGLGGQAGGYPGPTLLGSGIISTRYISDSSAGAGVRPWGVLLRQRGYYQLQLGASVAAAPAMQSGQQAYVELRFCGRRPSDPVSRQHTVPHPDDRNIYWQGARASVHRDVYYSQTVTDLDRSLSSGFVVYNHYPEDYVISLHNLSAYYDPDSLSWKGLMLVGYQGNLVVTYLGDSYSGTATLPGSTHG